MPWTEQDISDLQNAIKSGVKEVEYRGPPQRRVEYQDLSEMRKLLADMRAEVYGGRKVRAVSFATGFRGSRFK